MIPLRQIEAAELLVNANDFSTNYVSAILAGTPQAELVTPQMPKRLKGMGRSHCPSGARAFTIARSANPRFVRQDLLHLTVVKEYLLMPTTEWRDQNRSRLSSTDRAEPENDARTIPSFFLKASPSISTKSECVASRSDRPVLSTSHQRFAASSNTDLSESRVLFLIFKNCFA
jgi:hypothetical protein